MPARPTRMLDHCLTLHGKSASDVRHVRDFLVRRFSDALEPSRDEPEVERDLASQGYTHSLTIFFRNGSTDDEADAKSDEMASALEQACMTVSRCYNRPLSEERLGRFAQRFLF